MFLYVNIFVAAYSAISKIITKNGDDDVGFSLVFERETPFFSQAKLIFTALLVPVLAATSLQAHALGADIGDWVPPTPGHNLFAWYGVRAENSGIYQNGKVVNKEAQLDANVSLVRFTNPVHVGDSWIGNPQFALQVAELSPKHMNGLSARLGLLRPLAE